MNRMHPVIKDKFSSLEMGKPVILSSINKKSKVLFNFLISAFSLVIGLWMISSSEGVDYT